MAEMKDFAGSVAIFVSSCDPFFDCWRPFVQFFRKSWPDCPLPVYLIVNELRARSNWIQPIAVGPDRTWGRKLLKALDKVPQPYVLYMQEDYFLTRPVDSAQLAADLAYALENELDSFCFRARSQREAGFAFVNERFGVVPTDSDGRTRCQANLWKRESLAAIVREEESVWEFEARGSERTRGMQIVSYGTRENVPLDYLMSAIVRGLWTREAIELCRAHQIDLSPRLRAVYTDHRLLQRLRRASTRRRIEHELVRLRDAVIDLDAPSR